MNRKGDWQELVRRFKVDDNLPVRSAGQWTANKLWVWHQYIGITTKAMVGRDEWSAGVCYVDLFAGPGVCRLRDTNERIPGSPLIAAYAPKPFAKILLAEMDSANAAACRARMDASPAADAYQLFEGDCNEHVRAIAREIPDRALTLAVIDPVGLDVAFESIRALSERGRVDLLILLADRMDGGRNRKLYIAQKESKLDRFLGFTEWRSILPKESGPKFREALRKLYEERLQTELGYCDFGYRPLEGDGLGPLYKMVYATKNPRGLDFWNKVTQRERGGQRSFFPT